MSVGEYIARGWEATVFEWDDGSGPPKALKLFYASHDETAVREEHLLSKRLQDAGVNMPGVFGSVVEVDGRFGIVFERIYGPSMIDMMASRPWKVRSLARKLAETQVEMHRLRPAGLPDLKSLLAHEINQSEHLETGEKSKSLYLLESLPDGDTLCHGDFHPGNVLLRGGSVSDPVIIDWGNAALGDPVADLARSELLITISWRLLPRRRDRYLARFIVALFSRWHMSHYLKVTGLDSSNLARWRTVIGAARLNEDIPAEREPLTKLVRAGLAQA